MKRAALVFSATPCAVACAAAGLLGVGLVGVGRVGLGFVGLELGDDAGDVLGSDGGVGFDPGTVGVPGRVPEVVVGGEGVRWAAPVGDGLAPGASASCPVLSVVDDAGDGSTPVGPSTLGGLQSPAITTPAVVSPASPVATSNETTRMRRRPVPTAVAAGTSGDVSPVSM